MEPSTIFPVPARICIIEYAVTDLPEPIPSKLCDNGNKWQLENYQRDCIMRGLKDAADDDVVMISDLDEIPNPEMIKNYKDGIQVFHQAMMYYFLNNINIVDSVWKNGTRIGHFSDLKNPNQDLRDECCYEYSKKGMPTYFRFCKGTVVETNILAGTIKVQLERRPEAAPSVYSKKDVKIIKDGKIQVDKSELDALKGIE